MTITYCYDLPHQDSEGQRLHLVRVQWNSFTNKNYVMSLIQWKPRTRWMDFPRWADTFFDDDLQLLRHLFRHIRSLISFILIVTTGCEKVQNRYQHNPYDQGF